MVQILSRYVPWLVAVTTALLPVLLSIVSVPSKILDVVHVEIWAEHYKDINFTVIALISVSIVDGVDILVRKVTPHSARVFSAIIVISSLLLAVSCAAWAVTPQGKALTSDAVALLRLLLGTIFVSFLQRTIVILGDSHD